jgi:hypothetical protein
MPLSQCGCAARSLTTRGDVDAPSLNAKAHHLPKRQVRILLGLFLLWRVHGGHGGGAVKSQIRQNPTAATSHAPAPTRPTRSTAAAGGNTSCGSGLLTMALSSGYFLSLSRSSILTP